MVIFIFCHLKSPEGNLNNDVRLSKYSKEIYYDLGNCPHEMGGSVLSSQFAGSRAMMQACNLMIGLHGNKDPNLIRDHPNLINQRWLSINEDRAFGNSAHIPIYRNPNTTIYREN